MQFFAKLFARIIKHLPIVLEVAAAALGLVTRFSCRWYIKALIWLVIIILAMFFIDCIANPYAVDIEHPIDTAERLINLGIGG